jgi:hypothetical protein
VKATRTDIANWRAKKIYGEYILAHLEDMPSNSAQKNKACMMVFIIVILFSTAAIPFGLALRGSFHMCAVAFSCWHVAFGPLRV